MMGAGPNLIIILSLFFLILNFIIFIIKEYEEKYLLVKKNIIYSKKCSIIFVIIGNLL